MRTTAASLPNHGDNPLAKRSRSAILTGFGVMLALVFTMTALGLS